MTSLAPWVIAFGLGTLAAAAVALWIRARDRRQIELLLARIERLEAARPETASDRLADDSGAAQRLPIDAPELPGANASGDVLVGRTSHVQRLIDGSKRPPSSLADQAILCVHRHVAENMAPGDLAAHLCVSLRTLERGLAQTLSCTPRQLILTMKMREARSMLMQGFRVSEVADRLGFVNVFHFSRRFKGLYHVTPSEVRSLGGEGAPAAR